QCYLGVLRAKRRPDHVWSIANRRTMGSPLLGYAPWHFLNFLPEPHQQGSFRPILSRSAVTRCCVATAPPPPSPVLPVMPSPPSPAAAIASAPDSASCSYAKPPPSTSSESVSSSASRGSICAWKRSISTSSRISRPSSSNIPCPSE